MARERNNLGQFVKARPASYGGGAIRAEGLDNALRSLHKDIGNVMFKTRKGLIAGGLIAQREAQKLCPVDTGNLKASGTTLWATKAGTSTPNFKGKDAAQTKANHARVVAKEKASLSRSEISPEVEVVFTAAYALFVHEDLEAKHPVGQARFLSDAVASNQGKILSAVKMEASL